MAAPFIYHVLTRLHRYLGLSTAAFLTLAGLTGAVIAFHHELDSWLNPSLFRTAGGTPLSPSLLAARVEAADPRIRVAFVEVNPEAGRSAVLWVEPRTAQSAPGYNQVFCDPATGEIVGRRQYGSCCLQPENLIPFLYNLHRRLAMPGHWGDWLMGGVALLWSVDCLVALALTFPRRLPFLARWKTAWRIRPTGSAFRFAFDLHRAGGLWLWVPLLIIALSSVYLNLGTEIFRPVVALVASLSPTPYDRERPGIDAERKSLSFDDILAIAGDFGQQRQWPEKVRGLYHDREAGLYVVDFGTGRETGRGAPWLAIDEAKGNIVHVQAAGEGTAGDAFVALQFPLHSGRVAGLPGRIFIAFLGVAIAVLSITGVIIWNRKRRTRVRRATTAPQQPHYRAETRP
jgi:uncharacterized iron-regulated membrane protein